MSGASTVLRTGLPAGATQGIRTTSLRDGWKLASTSPGGFDAPPTPDAEGLAWRDAIVPGTVAQSVGPDELDGHAGYDARDWWYRCRFDAPSRQPDDRVHLRFDGLATLADVWLNGERILAADDMFCAHGVDVTALLRDHNELAIAFRSLDAALATRRPRPRWKTRLVEHQQLRWFRTTLLGRIPGWTPSIEAVGPWKPVWIEVGAGPRPVTIDLRTAVDGTDGVVRLEGEIDVVGSMLDAATLRVSDAEGLLTVERRGDGWLVHGEARLPDASLWWPRTHGTPALHACALRLETPEGAVSIDLGRVGFRVVEVDHDRGGVRIVVNGVPVFCRGACWTSNDIVSLTGDPSEMRRTLDLVADAHANMVRVGGTMVYETDDFYSACDELGILVWQDFMFANMDYPATDEDFVRRVEAEVDHQLRRLQRHASVAVLCGGSEIEQQAAMFGAPREVWAGELLTDILPAAVARLAPDRPYWSSTPTGGALPFQVGEGIAHYFGVGAYLRPPDDARTAGVRFSPECLGFSNVPEPENTRLLTEGGAAPPHHPAWKAGVPRDSGAGWDFEDVRDHYLGLLYGVDPVDLRSTDPERYLAMSRVVTGRLMAGVFDEWRSSDSGCGGGLVWFLKDLRPGAGWGIIDSQNRPKAAYYHLKRAWAPVRLILLDRGLDGVRIEVRNETPEELTGTLRVEVLNAGSTVTAREDAELAIPAWGVTSTSVENVVGYFVDSTYAYRFGPLGHAAIAATMHLSDGRTLEAVRWSALHEPLATTTLEVDVAQPTADGSSAVDVATGRLACDVRIACEGWSPSDNYFDVVPGRSKHVHFRAARADGGRPEGYVDARNGTGGVRLP